MLALRNILLLLALLLAILAAQAGSAKVLKVLPHYLDDTLPPGNTNSRFY